MPFSIALFQSGPATAAPASVDPAAALVVFSVLAILAAALFWPVRGIIPRARRLTRLDERVRIEDALKHLTNT